MSKKHETHECRTSIDARKYETNECRTSTDAEQKIDKNYGEDL